MEIFLIILKVIAVAAISTLITNCFLDMTLNPFKYFRENWDLGYIQWCFGIYVLAISIFTCISYMHWKEEKLHSIKTEWNENTGYYNITVSGSEIKGINIIHKENND